MLIPNTQRKGLSSLITTDTPGKGVITIYPRYIDAETRLKTNILRRLSGTFWTDVEEKAYQPTGVITPRHAKVFIPFSAESVGRSYIAPEDWMNQPYEDMRDNCWTIDPKQPTGAIMLQGVCEHEFEFVADDEPNKDKRLVQQEVLFMANHPKAVRVKSISAKTFGSERFWHFVVLGV